MLQVPIKMNNTSKYFGSKALKIEEIKNLLDGAGSTDKDKMEGMKRLIAMMSKGTEVSSLFPSVVKLVVCKNIEVKKLVYIYLVHYSELESDAALLAINTLKRDLEDPNQLIRAHALRVMSSIRVKIIIQLVVLAVKKAVTDSSPYVRKTAAHALTKIYSLDVDHKETLIDLVEHLLNDGTTMVLGSAVAAFNELCPTKYELIHPHFRKLCHLLADTDEWGQLHILALLLRYGRVYFSNPDKPKVPKTKQPKTNDKGSGSGSEDESSEDDDYQLSSEESMDPDHRLLLKMALPLLQSRNSGVVLGVASLYFYLAPAVEAQKVGKSLVRILRNSRETKYIVLSNIATMAVKNPGMFQPYLGDFFVDADDPSYIRILKLDIITSLANESNISRILKEFKTYVGGDDKQFVAATIQAIGRTATTLKDAADSCMNGLMSLVSNRSEIVIAESVVVIKQLLQMPTSEEHQYDDVVKQLARLLESVQQGSARASIIWVIGEHLDKLKLIAPDVLRKLAKTFSEESDIVKLQIINLGCKLFLTNPEQTTKIFQYVLSLAKYDQNYDIRDKARVVRKIIFGGNCQSLQANARSLFMAPKPVPVSTSAAQDRQRFVIGSLSHIVNHTVPGYISLEEFSEAPPKVDRTSKTPFQQIVHTEFGASTTTPTVSTSQPVPLEEFYTPSESSSSYSSYDSEEGSYSSSDEDSYEEGSYSYSDDEDAAPHQTSNPQYSKNSQTDEFFDFGIGPPSTTTPLTSGSNASSSLADLLTLNPIDATPVLPMTSSYSAVQPSGATNKHTLLNSINSGGLTIEYSYLRLPSHHGPNFNPVRLWFKNNSEKNIQSIRLSNLVSNSSVEVKIFDPISVILPGMTVEATMHVDFSQSASNPIKFEITCDLGTFSVTLNPSVGELVRPTSLPLGEFETKQKQLGGLCEVKSKVKLDAPNVQLPQLPDKVLRFANVGVVHTDLDAGHFNFAGMSLKDSILLLTIIVDKVSGEGTLTVNCPDSIFGTQFVSKLKQEVFSR
eukprot:TRINITY_DN9994_c0_g1_i1.p1 TRINITY_DN9994_c0_g1~~TRINITY_DN9994_c0_g1_i1.p1  ORF type:complete len:1013 (+),score=198.95 TRINITY_DN9994_c0_g1_i1:103-3141(+)